MVWGQAMQIAVRSSKDYAYFEFKPIFDLVNNLGPESRRQFDNDLDFRHEKILFTARADGELLGYGFLEKLSRKRYVVKLGVVVADKWQGHGYGRALCQSMIHWAFSAPQEYRKIWLA